jgi:hypothetical protein
MTTKKEEKKKQPQSASNPSGQAEPILDINEDKKKEIQSFIDVGLKAKTNYQTIRKTVIEKFELNKSTYDKFFKQPPKRDRKKAPKIPKIVKRIEPVNYRHEFSDQEKLVKGNTSAQLDIEIADLKANAKAVASDFKAKIEEKETQRTKISQHINSGFEMRNADCEVTRDFDKGKKFAYLNKKLVKEELLTAEDHVAHLKQQTMLTEENFLSPEKTEEAAK